MLQASSIQFLWPMLLWSLALWPLVAYILWFFIYKKSTKLKLRFAFQTNLGVRGALTITILWLLGFVFLLLALARPQSVIMLPSRLDTVMLALDTSGSMRATDVAPNRMDAALKALKVFIDEQPYQVKVGIVAFAGTASVVQAPSTQRDDLNRAVANIPLQRGSALGSALVVSLANLLPGSGIDPEKIIMSADRSSERDVGRQLPTPGRGDNQKPLDPGSNKSMAIVLISDGQSNIGPDALKMAQLAADHGVRVYTVGIGTLEGAIVKANGMSMRVRLDETSLKKIAEITRADYFHASSAAELLKIYRDLGTTIRLEKNQITEVTGLFLLLGLLLILIAAIWQMYNLGRVI